MSTTPDTNFESLQEIGISRIGVIVRARESETGRSVLVFPSGETLAAPASTITMLDATGNVRRLATLVAQAARILAERHIRGEADGQLRTDRVSLVPGPGGEEVVCVTPPSLEGTIHDEATPFTAPEQAVRGAVTPAADVWALGVIFYQGLTGRLLFAGSTPLETLHRLVCDSVPRLREIEPEIPAELEAICLRCLHRDPRVRYQNAGEVAEALEAWIAGRPRGRRVSRGWLAASGSVVAVLVLAFLLRHSLLHTPATSDGSEAVDKSLQHVEDLLRAGRVFEARERFRMSRSNLAGWTEEQHARAHRLEQLHQAHRWQVEGEVPLDDRQGGWCGFSRCVRYSRDGKWYVLDVQSGQESDLSRDFRAKAEPIFDPSTKDVRKYESDGNEPRPFLHTLPARGLGWEIQMHELMTWKETRDVIGGGTRLIPVIGATRTFRFPQDEGPGWEARWPHKEWPREDPNPTDGWEIDFCRGPLPATVLGSDQPFLIQANYGRSRRWNYAVNSRLSRWADPPGFNNREPAAKGEPWIITAPDLDAPKGRIHFDPPALPAFVHIPGKQETLLLISPDGDRFLTIHRSFDSGPRHWFNVWVLPGDEQAPPRPEPSGK